MSQPDPGAPQPPEQPPTYYAQPHQPPSYGYYQPPRTNSNAIASMIVSIASLFVCPIVGAVGVYLGNRARREIRGTGEQGDGMALAGVIIGWIAIGLGLLSILLVIGWFVFVFGIATSATLT